jgi:EAL and modified HD-GYP domain-containing signal transduction protein
MPGTLRDRSQLAPVPASGGSAQGSRHAGAEIPLPRFITRQPVLDGEYRVVGYELKINERSLLPVLPGASTLQQVQDEALLVSVVDLDYQHALGNRLTLLNLMPTSLDNPLVEKLPRENAILAVHATDADPALLARCQALSRLGYALALDEADQLPGLAPLARQSRYLRLEVSDHELAALCDRVTVLRQLGGRQLIARNVGTEESYAVCRKLGFDLYQGYFFTQLRPSEPQGLDMSRLRIMELLNLVMSHAEFPAIEAQFRLDAGLTYKLLRYINSPGVGLRYPVRSIGHVLILLGHDQLYRWLTLLLFTHGRPDPRSQTLLRNALVRARFTEILGEGRMEPGLYGGLFITGILSMLEALLNCPMGQAIASLKLAPPIVEALLDGEGPYAPYLHLATACENQDPSPIGALSADLGLSPEEVNLAHIKALIWSEGVDSATD